MSKYWGSRPLQPVRRWRLWATCGSTWCMSCCLLPIARRVHLVTFPPFNTSAARYHAWQLCSDVARCCGSHHSQWRRQDFVTRGGSEVWVYRGSRVRSPPVPVVLSVYQLGSLLDGRAMYMSCDTKKFRDNESTHSYYIISGRPPIGGKLPPPPGGATALNLQILETFAFYDALPNKELYCLYVEGDALSSWRIIDVAQTGVQL